MNKLTKLFSNHAFCLLSFIFFGSLLVSENAFSKIYWQKRFTTVNHNRVENSILIKFLIFDNYFGMKNLSAYLKKCDFYFTTDENNYFHLMRAETEDQVLINNTSLKLSYKLSGTNLVLFGCTQPANASVWRGSKDRNILVKNEFVGKIEHKFNDYNILIIDHYIAIFTVKWSLGDQYRDVKRIRLDGVWQVYGSPPDKFTNIDYDLQDGILLKSSVSQSENNRVKVASQADAIVITGAGNGENIKVYNTFGAVVQSTVSTSDVVNIKLPKNQIYIVNVGQTRHIVAM